MGLSQRQHSLAADFLKLCLTQPATKALAADELAFAGAFKDSKDDHKRRKDR